MRCDHTCVPRELEYAAIAAIRETLPAATVHMQTPSWLMRPGASECGEAWSLVSSIYRELSGLELPEVMPARERRQVDAVVEIPGAAPRIFEFDESQHFNVHRAVTLRAYPAEMRTGFPRERWLEASESSQRTLGTTGGWGKAKRPLFPEAGGRHLQRAFRDALADILPPVHGWAPTLRVADFEVRDWIHDASRSRRIAVLLESRLV